MFTQKILMPTTEQAFSTQFGLTIEDASLTIFCTGLEGGETAVLQYQDEFDNEWYDVKILLPDGTTKTPTFNSISNIIFIENDWGIYRFNKSASSAEVGIFIRRFINAGAV